jgi:ABC-type dipeptide/oligopeptide/nickel transport system permease component
VASDILHFFPATLELATFVTVIGVFVGVPAAVAAGAL